MISKYSRLIRYLVFVCSSFYFHTSHGAQYGASLQWANRASLSLPTSATVSEVLVKPGQRINKGTVMLRLDQRHFQAKLAAAKATVDQYKPGRDEAEKELGRQQELYDRTVASQVELDLAKQDFAEKDALYKNALAHYQQAKVDLENTELRAPYDLIVIRPRVSVGQSVANIDQAIPLIDVADADSWMASILVNPDDIQALTVGKQVQVVAGDQTLNGHVSMLDVIDDGRGDVKYRLEINIKSNQDGGLRLGRKATISWQ